MLFIGIDVGTQGVRAVAVDGGGNIAASAQAAFERLNLVDDQVLREQLPADWWSACVAVLKELTAQIDASDVAALSVDATSGTVLLADEYGEALGTALMYNDGRAREEAAVLSAAAEAYEKKLGYRINSSYALPKLAWLKAHRPEDWSRAAYVMHQADYITAKLTGVCGVTDFSNALKTGYDIVDLYWPAYIAAQGLADKLPNVAAPGEPIARVSAQAAKLTGLCQYTVVCAGATDGYASAISAGAVAQGEWASIIGTTFVIKGVTGGIVRDDAGRVYCHRHPDGLFMPGGASNVGGRCLNDHFDKRRFSELDAQCGQQLPTGALVYPLSGRGERFPYVAPEAEAFEIDMPASEPARFAAYMEGVAYVERLSYDVLADLGCTVGSDIYAVGGASKSDVWLKIRASVLRRTLLVPCDTSAALGSAIIAASKTGFDGIVPAARAMVRIAKRVEPDETLADKYDILYKKFAAMADARFGK